MPRRFIRVSGNSVSRETVRVEEVLWWIPGPMLAGGLLSYVGAPIAVAAGANIVGNQFDDPAAQQGELPM